MDLQSERILNLGPQWYGIDAVITPRSGCITNQNYRVDIDDASFVLLNGGNCTKLCGIDRERERACTAIAAQVGVGAEVVSSTASESAEILVTRFIAGTNLSSESAAQPEMLPRIVESMRRYHDGP